MKPPRILLITDDPTTAGRIQKRLEDVGLEIAATTAPRLEALREAAEKPADLVLLDVGSEDTEGALATARLLADTFDFPILLLTSASTQAMVQPVSTNEPFVLLMKDAPDRELRTGIEAALYRHRTEKRIRDNEHWLSTMLHSFEDAVIASDSEDRVRFINTIAETLTEWPAAEAMGKRVDEVAPFSGKPRKPSSDSQSSSGWLFGGMSQSERSLTTRTGKKILVEDRITALRDDWGGYLGSLLVFRDVTERRQQEQQFFQARKMEAIGTLAGGVAHDFNNLLTVIIGYAEQVADRHPEGDTTRTEIDEIRNAARRAAALTLQLLAFSRQQVLRPKILNLNTTVAEVEKMLRRLIGEHIELAVALEPQLGAVKVDPVQIAQILLNLAVNARDAMAQGGRLVISTSNAVVDQEAARRHVPMRAGSYVRLTVSDSGCGMDEKTRLRVFEPFFTTKGLGRGTGLGLSTVYGIVKQSDGFIWVYSELGAGSAFKIYLPRVDEAPDLTTEEAEPSTLSGAETILLVEDEEVLREMTARVLRKHGYNVLEAKNGDEALNLAKAHPKPVQLILTDVVMPGLSGPKLVERFLVIQPDVKVVYISGYPDEAVVRRGGLGPGAAFLEKPFRTRALLGKIRELLGQPVTEADRG